MKALGSIVEDCFLCTWLHCEFLLDVSLLGLALRSCLLMPPGNLRHAGGWHLRRKPCVDLFFVLLFSLTATCSDESRQIMKNFHLRVIGSRIFVKLVCTHCIIRCFSALKFVTLHGFHSNLSLIVYSGCACERSDVTTSWCIHCHPFAPGWPTWSCILQNLHTSVLRMIPMNFLFNVTLCYDQSCTRATLFSVFPCCVVSLATHFFDGRMDLSVETVLHSNRRHVPSRKHILKSGNWFMTDQNVTPSKTLHKQLEGREQRLCPQVSNGWTHRHRNLHGKLLEILRHFGSSLEPRIFQPSGKRHRKVFAEFTKHPPEDTTVSFRQQHAHPFIRTKPTEYLQVESRTST